MKRVEKHPAPAGVAHLPAVERGQAGAITLLWCLIGLLIPRAALYGQLAPFGVSLAAAMHKPAAPVILSLAVGYLLAGDVLYPIRYIAAVAVVGGLRWVLAAVPQWQKRTATPPLTAFAATLATGLALYGATGLDGYRVMLLLAESGIAAGCALFFRVAVSESTRLLCSDDLSGMLPARQASVILTGAVVMMAASTLTIGEFSPGRVLSAGLVLVLARSGQEQGGSMAGILVGATTALAAPQQTVLALALVLGGLMAGVFSRFGRLAQTAAFLVAACVIMLVDTGENVLIHIYELFAACVLFLLLPKSLDRSLHRLILRGRDQPAVEGVRCAVTMRLQVAARTMDEVAQTVGVVTERLAQCSVPNTAAIYQSSCRTVCGACPLHKICWVENRDEMLASLDKLTPILQQHGVVSALQLSDCVGDRCRRPERLAEYINRCYEKYIVRESAWRRLGEIQHSISDQFSGMGALLGSIAQDVNDPRQVDVELSERVLAVCADYGMPVRQTLCSRGRNNRLTVEILAQDIGMRLSDSRWFRDMQQACVCTFAPPVVTDCGDEIRILLTEPSRYRVEIGLAQRRCDAESLCGDCAETFTQDGRTVLMLSDGMGSGGRAAVDGAMAVGLTSRLWKAGFSPDSILHSVNAALLIKSREESLATLDVTVIDTFSGRMDSYKAGAAATLLYSGGRVSRLERSSLPIGILPDVRFEHSSDWLVDGDVLVMLSDGALCDGVAAVEDLLRKNAGVGMQALAELIVDAAHKAQGDHPDDITAITVRLLLSTDRRQSTG